MEGRNVFSKSFLWRFRERERERERERRKDIARQAMLRKEGSKEARKQGKTGGVKSQ